MRQKATQPPVLQYFGGRPHRPRRAMVLILGGSVAQFALLLLLSFHRDVAWIDRLAWVLEWPLFRLAWAFDVALSNRFTYLLGMVNGLCWSLLGFAVVALLRRMWPAAGPGGNLRR